MNKNLAATAAFLTLSLCSCTPSLRPQYTPPSQRAKVDWQSKGNPAATTPVESGVRRETDTRRYDDLNRRY